MNEISPPELPAVARFMREHGLLLTTAESCTAGLIAATLADLPGAGSLLECAFVVYSAAAKQRCLCVSPQTIARCNLTSEEVAREMAVGALARGPATLAIANTGVADSVDPAIPAGTQCFAWAFAADEPGEPAVFSATQRFFGERNSVRMAAAEHALLQIPYYYRQWQSSATAARALTR